MVEDKIYEYDVEKPTLTKDFLEGHDAICHFNKNHDPKNGQFTFGSGGSGGIVEKYKAKKKYKQKVKSAERARQVKQEKANAAKRAQDEQDKREKEQLEREQWRQDVIRRGDVKTASEHTDEFSKEEVDKIIERYQTNQKLSALMDDINKVPKEIPKEQKSNWEKAGDKLNDINKFVGPLSSLVKNAAEIKTNYEKLNAGKPQQNQQQPQQNQQKQSQPAQQQPQQAQKKTPAQKPKELSNDQKKVLDYLNNKALDAEVDGHPKQAQAFKQAAADVYNGKKSASSFLKDANDYKIDFNTKNWSEKTTLKTKKAAEGVANSSKSSKAGIERSVSNIAANPNAPGAINQLVKDFTKNTKTTSGQPLNLNNDWLANQSTEVLRLMKRNIDKTSANSSAQTIADINRILKKRGMASPLR